MTSTLTVGVTFNSIQSAKDDVLKFCDDNFVNFVVDTNNKKSLRFVCKHGTRQRVRGTGNRPNQHQNFLDCKASISFFKSQKLNNLKCTKIENQLDHPVSKQIYKYGNAVLTEEEILMSSNLKNGNSKPSQIKRILLEKFNKQITIQKLKNALAKTSTDDKEDDINFVEFF